MGPGVLRKGTEGVSVRKKSYESVHASDGSNASIHQSYAQLQCIMSPFYTQILVECVLAERRSGGRNAKHSKRFGCSKLYCVSVTESTSQIKHRYRWYMKMIREADMTSSD